MKYIRVVLAVEDYNVEKFKEQIDNYIEGHDTIEGAYMASPYSTRDEAVYGVWNDDEMPVSEIKSLQDVLQEKIDRLSKQAARLVAEIHDVRDELKKAT